MIPIHRLLSRIRWDAEFGQGDFTLGYYDRVRAEIIKVPLAEILFPRGRADVIQVMTPEGLMQSIPLHRIREVYKDNTLIWHRPM